MSRTKFKQEPEFRRMTSLKNKLDGIKNLILLSPSDVRFELIRANGHLKHAKKKDFELISICKSIIKRLETELEKRKKENANN